MEKEDRLSAELRKLSESDIYPFHMPGHKRNIKQSVLSGAFEIDITEIDGFDDLSSPNGLIRRIEERAEKHYGADRAFLLVNGSTCGILSAVSALVPHRGKLILSRNSHKSAFNAAYLGELETRYIEPVYHEKYGLCGEADLSCLKNILEKEPDTDAVLITSPVYEGFISDVDSAAKTVHSYDIPLIVDAAHGAHLNISKMADVTIVSLHKTCPALTSSALCLVNGSRIDTEKLKFYINIFQTSSPSYVLMAGMDECFNILEKEGRERARALEKELEEVYGLCEKTTAIKLITKKEVQALGGYDFDASKLNLYDKSGVLSGRDIYDILLKKYGIQPEMALGRFCLCLSSLMDTKDGFLRLCEAVRQIDDDLRSNKFG